jgi:hypothetical protein
LCNTVGCPVDQVASPDHLFCVRCGWPLGRAQVGLDEEEVVLVDGTDGHLTVRVDNRGLGALRWEMAVLPPGVLPLDSPRVLHPGATQTVPLRITSAALAGADTLSLSVRTFDRAGDGPLSFRPFDSSVCWQERRVEVRLSRPRVGPVLVPWRSLLFAPSIPLITIRLTNGGELPLTIEAVAEGGYGLAAVGEDSQPQTTIALQPDQSRALTVYRCDARGNGAIILRDAAQRDREWARLPVFWLDAGGSWRPLDRRYVVGVDLGTSKTAAAVLDSRVAGGEPEILLWEGHPDGPQEWTPSEVAFDDSGQPIACGFDVMGRDALPMLDRLKMRMTEDDDRVHAGIVFLLRAVLDQVALRYGYDIFAKATCVFSVPALDMGEEYGKHKGVYRDLIAEAAEAYGLDMAHVRFSPEPECAAVEHLYRLQVDADEHFRSFALGPGDWVCVLDIGAGTTDITFAQVALAPDGSIDFSSTISAGYPFAGDYVDERLLAWCLGQWKGRNLLRSQPTGEDAEVAVGEDKWPRQRVLDHIRLEKEKLYADVQADQVVEAVPLDMFLGPALLELSRRTISEQLQTVCEALYRTGAGAIGREIGHPPVQAWLAREGASLKLAGAAVKAIFLSGGTCNIPDFSQRLREMVLRRAEIVKAADLRLHVVRGATRRPDITAKDRLVGDLTLRCGPSEPRLVLPRGAVPQIGEPFVSDPIPPRGAFEAAIAVRFDGREAELYTLRAVNEEDEHLSAEIVVEYAAGGHLSITASWLTDPRIPIVSHELIQPLPTL